MVAAAPLPEALSSLRELALDLRWTWSHEADALWARIDADLWERSHNPWVLLQNAPAARLIALAGDPGFLAELDEVMAVRRAYRERSRWFDKARGETTVGGIAYFSLEFGLGAALPLYAGGLGVLAGDYLKAASDLGVPVTGVGLLYQEGYFRQTLDLEGGQRESYPFNEPATMPIEPAMVGGEWLKVPAPLPGRTLQLRVWFARVGQAALYLLDSNDPLNSPADRGITGKLYGDGPETRLSQEVALGVGGWAALEALGRAPDICHINEGHAAFAVMERARRLALAQGLTFEQALWATRPGNVFTTHTPMATGFDRFDPEMVRRYLPQFEAQLAAEGQPPGELLRLGRANADDPAEPFNMAWLAMRGCGVTLAVSRLHEKVSRGIFQPLFPRWPPAELPLDHVTNGVHVPSWDSSQADQLWTDACGKARWLECADAPPADIASASDGAIWAMRGLARQTLVRQVRGRLALQLRARGLASEAAAVAAAALDPNILTLGLARRFTAYKRPNLLLRDPDRLARILLDPRRPAQIVLAGKAHPADEAGKAMIREWIAFANRPGLRSRVVFLEDYDLALAQELVQGVDVWINTPRRPWEACGTSGMKVLVNGGLNCSVRDGWWAEAYAPDVGWAIGDGGHGGGGDDDDAKGDEEARDAADAEAAYQLLEQQVAPEFYERDESGAPRAWVARIRRSMATLTSVFSCGRMVADYVEKAYLPGAAALHRRLADGCVEARGLAAWAARLGWGWAGLHIGEPVFSPASGTTRVSVPVMLGAIGPDEVAVEAYADACGDWPATAAPLAAAQPVAGSVNGYVFVGALPAGRAAQDFTVRVRPSRPGAAVPAELPLIAWQR